MQTLAKTMRHIKKRVVADLHTKATDKFKTQIEYICVWFTEMNSWNKVCFYLAFAQSDRYVVCLSLYGERSQNTDYSYTMNFLFDKLDT